MPELDFITVTSLFGLVFTAGVIAGVELGFRRWRRNADEIQRVEWRGRLYKVEHAEWQSPDEFWQSSMDRMDREDEELCP